MRLLHFSLCLFSIIFIAPLCSASAEPLKVVGPPIDADGSLAQFVSSLNTAIKSATPTHEGIALERRDGNAVSQLMNGTAEGAFLSAQEVEELISQIKRQRGESGEISATIDVGESYSFYLSTPFLINSSAKLINFQKTGSARIFLEQLSDVGYSALGFVNVGFGALLGRQTETLSADIAGRKILAVDGAVGVEQLLKAGATLVSNPNRPASTQAATSQELIQSIVRGNADYVVVPGSFIGTQRAIRQPIEGWFSAGQDISIKSLTFLPRSYVFVVKDTAWTKLSTEVRLGIEDAFIETSNAANSNLIANESAINNYGFIANSSVQPPTVSQSAQISNAAFDIAYSRAKLRLSPQKMNTIWGEWKYVLASGSQSSMSGDPYNNIEVFFATDRKPVSKAVLPIEFSGDVAEPPVLSFGRTKVSGGVNRPSGSGISEDVRFDGPHRMQEEEFYSELKSRLRASGNGRAIVFIHGYNNSFAAAIERASSIYIDAKLEGVMIAYSWPSNGKTANYRTDERQAARSFDRFIDFIQSLEKMDDVKEVVVLAHSMGAQLVLNWLSIDSRSSSIGERSNKITHVVFAAPDVDRDVFLERIGRVSQVQGRTIVLYAADGDLALKVSSSVNGGRPRAGIGGRDIATDSKMESLDASAIVSEHLGVGHDYIASNRSVLSDINMIINHKMPPARRPNITSATNSKNAQYWVFR